MIAYTQGNLRYHLYYSKTLGFLMRDHIREQIDYRINSMDKKCYNNGSCKMCGCQTPHLQMSSKKCEGDCYPRMKNKKCWKEDLNFRYSIQEDWEENLVYGFDIDICQEKFIKEKK